MQRKLRSAFLYAVCGLFLVFFPWTGVFFRVLFAACGMFYIIIALLYLLNVILDTKYHD